ncbi:MAG TPA: phenylalanine--tRNA ligase subunit alpha [Usitatibacter sp.]|jgi:phenylalanyl-tRNA synthetase alpha chain|nr:phenylalanine--tRNA ligase subunit alpha [Usitatibacter sp.]
MQALEEILRDASQAIGSTSSIADLEQAKARFLGKAGSLTELLKGLGKLPPEERRTQGASINQAKAQVESLVQRQMEQLRTRELESKLAAESVDVTLPGRRQSPGGLHPITLVQRRVEQLFASMGFSVADGPEIEDDEHNFTALRMFPNHPSRSMQDTFYVEGTSNVLRTHTSPVQIRYMESHKPPVRIICPGRVYRVDHDATHSPMFHQVEGLWVEEGVSLADLKGTITQFCRAFFERDDIGVRFRPSYFPFVEPGVEIDMEWSRKDGEVGYLEIAGAGVVHRDVLKNVGIDPAKYSGFAFGMGIDRLAMLKYGVNDLRLFFENDLQFLAQFR